jgi:lipoprotein-anchoring transpeptidase ErfK/SrfK
MRIPKRPLLHLQLVLLLILVPLVASESGIVEPVHSQSQPLELKVSLSSRTLQVIEGGSVVQTYPVAIGALDSPTPTGRFRTGRIEWNPGWMPPPRPKFGPSRVR